MPANAEKNNIIKKISGFIEKETVLCAARCCLLAGYSGTKRPHDKSGLVLVLFTESRERCK